MKIVMEIELSKKPETFNELIDVLSAAEVQFEDYEIAKQSVKIFGKIDQTNVEYEIEPEDHLINVFLAKHDGEEIRITYGEIK
jgi:cystathionine beta-lyase family protein involved in aluminum resistance